ncbi:hypothetical protein BKA70DRAFT_593028 [Coprinopsis sp. MPI-PUGE-AT-0042]|nr:hypothetical protein BKA70DRAFT_593028 [Coprinopsis sp. MPI-PUGE-AT-0042]
MAASKITATEKLLLSRLRAPQLRTKYIAPARSGNTADKRPPLLAPLWENLWYLGGLLTGFAYSKERPTGELVFGQKVLAELDKWKYHFHFTHLLRTISDQSVTPPYSSEKLSVRNFVGTQQTLIIPLACLNPFVTVLFKDTSRRSTSLLSHYTEFIKGGVLQIAANCSRFLTSTSEPMFQRLKQDLDTQYYAPLCADVVVIITSYSIYPPVLKALRHSLLQQPLTHSQLTGINVAMQSQGIIVERDRTTTRSMAEIRDAILASYDVYTYLTQGKDANAHLPDICDYSEHGEDSRTYKQGRVCSGCQSALYCSKQCQKRD